MYVLTQTSTVARFAATMHEALPTPVHLRLNPDRWPPLHTEIARQKHIPDRASVSSFVLLMSSLTMVLAVSAAQERDDRLTRIWLSVTALLGSTFVGAQVYEFTSFYHEGVGFTTSLFSSSFFTLTGFHGIHVTVGIIMLMSLVGIISRSKVPGDKAEVVELIGLYWHFVDIVWIVIFTLVYLIPA